MSEEPFVSDHTDIHSTAADTVAGTVMLVNIFTPKPGQAEAFAEAQTAEYLRLKGKISGWIGNRLGKSVDGHTFVNVAAFESLDTYKSWRESEAFSVHLEVIRPYVKDASPGMYEIIYSAGSIP